MYLCHDTVLFVTNVKCQIFFLKIDNMHADKMSNVVVCKQRKMGYKKVTTSESFQQNFRSSSEFLRQWIALSSSHCLLLSKNINFNILEFYAAFKFTNVNVNIFLIAVLAAFLIISSNRRTYIVRYKFRSYY
jgi:hypothetical protein